ncbi:unnamed protein product [Phytophthora lilii]|uniref:Unnamed protein product n=1 Tax=Phytophthora lilii TaxID=2077276 RepID=A0A9W6YJ05_9STRA|nr:unnamed protein product [Phytophthora lilii]
MRVLQIAGLALLWVWTGVQVVTAASCSDLVSSGDKAVGISAVDSPACPSAGGVGCFGGDSTCRFCMEFNTTNSAHLLPCSGTTVTPTVVPTPAPTAASTASSTPTSADDDCSEGLPVA